MPVIEHVRLPRFRSGELGAICVSVFEGQASLTAVEGLGRARREVGRRHPKVLNVNIVVGATVQMPERAVTEASARMQVEFAPTSLGAYTVIEGRGLAAVVGRSFLATMALITPSQGTEVFRTIDEAVAAMRRRPDELKEILQIPDLAEALEAYAHPR